MSRNDNPYSEAIQILAQKLGEEKLRADALVDELRIAQTQRDEAWVQRDQLLREQPEVERLRSVLAGQEREIAVLERERHQAVEDFLHDVIRFEVIDHREGKDGRVYTTAAEGAAQIRLDFQDDHHTLKVFVNDRPTPDPDMSWERFQRGVKPRWDQPASGGPIEVIGTSERQISDWKQRGTE
jgi:hypothetical protein